MTFSAQVTLPAGASGTVDFLNGTQVLCASVAVTGGQASCSVPRLPPGTATVQARYVPGDGNTSGSDSNTVTVTAAPHHLRRPFPGWAPGAGAAEPADRSGRGVVAQDGHFTENRRWHIATHPRSSP